MAAIVPGPAGQAEWCDRPSSLSAAQAAVACARADVVSWLHRDYVLRRCARAAEEEAFEDIRGEHRRGLVLRELTEHLGPQRMQEFQDWALQTHFWCELLAQMACALAQYEELRNRMSSVVEDVLSRGAESPFPNGMSHVDVIGFSVRATWRYVLEAIIVASGAPLPTLLARGGPLIWPIRVTAVLMCPDASRHRAVREHCWEPIVRHAGAEIRHAVRERLIQVFPREPW